MARCRNYDFYGRTKKSSLFLRKFLEKVYFVWNLCCGRRCTVCLQMLVMFKKTAYTWTLFEFFETIDKKRQKVKKKRVQIKTGVYSIHCIEYSVYSIHCILFCRTFHFLSNGISGVGVQRKRFFNMLFIWKHLVYRNGSYRALLKRVLNNYGS